MWEVQGRSVLYVASPLSGHGKKGAPALPPPVASCVCGVGGRCGSGALCLWRPPARARSAGGGNADLGATPPAALLFDTARQRRQVCRRALRLARRRLFCRGVGAGSLALRGGYIQATVVRWLRGLFAVLLRVRCVWLRRLCRFRAGRWVVLAAAACGGRRAASL